MLNRIWEAEESRTFVRRVTDYLAVIVFTPILIVIASSAAILLESEVATISRKISLIRDFSPAIIVVLSALPYISICAMLTITYLILPNTTVRPKSAVVAGVFIGIVYQTVQFIYIKFQIGVASYGAIYGGFAAIPLFIVWLRLSWMMVLYGAEIAVAYENQETYSFRPDISNLSIRSTNLLFLRVFHLIAKRFSEGMPALTPPQMSENLNIPLLLVRRLLQLLVRSGLVVKTARLKGREQTYQPARSTEDLRMQTVLEARGRLGDNPQAAKVLDEAEPVAASLRDLEDAVNHLAENKFLKEI